MKKFEQLFLETKGKPKDILHEFLDWELKSSSNAEKALSAIRRYIKYKQRNIDVDKYVNLEEVEMKADGTKTTKRLVQLSETDKNDPSKIMRLMGLDPLQWELVSLKMRRSYYDVSMKMRTCEKETSRGHPIYEYEPRKITNHTYLIEITTKPKQFAYDEDSILRLVEKFTSPPMVIYRNRNKKTNILAVSNITDFHFGDRARYETLEDAEKLFRYTVTNHLHIMDSRNIDPERILVIVGNDFYHIDNELRRTTGGRTQMLDTFEPREMFEKGVEVFAWAIENYRSVSPVDVIYIPGNHDKLLSFALCCVLKGIFGNCNDVAFNLEKINRKYYQWGLCGLGFGHAAKEKNRILNLMQVECSFWSESKYREFHQGHLHSEDVKEIPGVKFRRLPTIAPMALNDWEHESGYWSMREDQLYIYDKEKGKTDILITS